MMMWVQTRLLLPGRLDGLALLLLLRNAMLRNSPRTLSFFLTPCSLLSFSAQHPSLQHPH